MRTTKTKIEAPPAAQVQVAVQSNVICVCVCIKICVFICINKSTIALCDLIICFIVVVLGTYNNYEGTCVCMCFSYIYLLCAIFLLLFDISIYGIYIHAHIHIFDIALMQRLRCRHH